MSRPVHLILSTNTHVVTRTDANRLRLEEERDALPRLSPVSTHPRIFREGLVDNPSKFGVSKVWEACGPTWPADVWDESMKGAGRMFFKSRVRRKDGKEHVYYSVCESLRVHGGP
jgi:hypothetical protein